MSGQYSGFTAYLPGIKLSHNKLCSYKPKYFKYQLKFVNQQSYHSIMKDSPIVSPKVRTYLITEKLKPRIGSARSLHAYKDIERSVEEN